jgi:hypothetical protein
MASRHNELMGKHVLVTFKTTHIDRAGETGSQISKLGEIVDVDAAGWVVAVTADGEHIRCSVSKLHRAPAKGLAMGPRKRPIQLDYIAAEELIRDFHSARKPVTLRWLGRSSAIAVCEAAPNGTLVRRNSGASVSFPPCQ